MAEQGGKPSVKGVARLKASRVTRRLKFMALFNVIAATNPPYAVTHYLLKLCSYLCAKRGNDTNFYGLSGNPQYPIK